MATRKPAISKDAPLDDPNLYLNRELSLLAFQRRVLEEAQDPRHPLLERAKFLSILFSNMDEFFMVRVAGIMQRLESGKPEAGMDVRPIAAHLETIRTEVMALMESAYSFYWSELHPSLAKDAVRIIDYSELSETQREKLEAYFLQSVFPVLTPLAFDPGRPFPHISNLSLNIAALIKVGDGENFARVKVPDTIRHLVKVPADGDGQPEQNVFIWVEQLVVAHIRYLFPGLDVVEAHPFHVTRDAEVSIQEVESDDLLETIEEAVWERRFRDVVRLQVHPTLRPEILEILVSNLELDSSDVYRVNGPLDLGRLKHLLGVDRPDLKDRPFVPVTPPALLGSSDEDIFARIRQGDIMTHQPFESFQPVVDFLRKAARDPDVLAIKMTLYRAGRKSPVVEALLDAVENGKEVAVMVELKARFDEESNIEWARALEDEGVHVVYGLVGLKVHAKIALVVRREGDKIRRYVHMATGNYNAGTAKLYTDLGFFTADDEIGADATDLFNRLTGYSAKRTYRKLLIAPTSMRQGFCDLVDREVARQKAGEKGHIILKMNALEDPGIIRKLYEASQGGVQIDLYVRGICCLRPGLPGISETIKVTSILGRFLEHSRIYYFRNGGNEQIYMGSADMMPRNLNRRVEILFPVEDPKLMKRLRDEILGTYQADTARARHMDSDGVYTRVPHDGGMDSQAHLLALAVGR